MLQTVAAEYRDALTRTGITDVTGLAKAYVEAQSFLGNAVRIPGPDAGDADRRKFDERLLEKVPGLVRMPAENDSEGWRTFYQRLGAPEDVSGYKFDPVENLPEEIQAPTDEWLAGVFHKASVPAPQAKALRASIHEANVAAYTAAAEATRAAEASLRGEWGAGYDQRIALAMGLPTKLLSPEESVALRGEIERVGLGNSPLLMKLLATAALGFGEETFVQGRRVDGMLPASLQEVDAQIAEIQKNPAFLNSRDPTHKSLVLKARDLHEQKDAILKSRAA